MTIRKRDGVSVKNRTEGKLGDFDRTCNEAIAGLLYWPAGFLYGKQGNSILTFS
jgi:hypothetical protein